MRKLGVDEITPKHLEEIFSIAKEWWSKISSIPLIYEDAELFFKRSVTGVWVDENDNVIGYYIMSIVPHPFNLGYTIGELVSIVVKEEYRGSTLFLRIISDVLSECNLCEVDELHFSDTIQRPLYSVMEKLGFEKTGTIYRRMF